jgi:hypothetical protein
LSREALCIAKAATNHDKNHAKDNGPEGMAALLLAVTDTDLFLSNTTEGVFK